MLLTPRVLFVVGMVLIVAGVMGCNGGNGGAVLGDDPGVLPFAAGGEIPIQEGLTVGADPEAIELDPCDPETPTDPVSGKLLGKAAIGAYLLDADLLPLAGVEVTFSTSAGELESMGQPVLTDDHGLATDTLAVDEDHAGDVVVTADTADLSDSVTIPVSVSPVPEVTLEMDPAYLWPPNHKLRDVHAVFDGLECAAAPTIELVAVTSNEPDDDIGDGNTTGDIAGADIGTDDVHFQLRAERAGGGSGRVYTVEYRLIDAEDEEDTGTTVTATVTVPHDMGD
jgi:hypothetical protein